jgi:ABC-type uncharacterized transport system substrate-binding protein
MFHNTLCRFVRILIVVWLWIGFTAYAYSEKAPTYKVLVVMSYEEDNPWCVEIKEGIDSVLANNYEVKYFYMDTKKSLEGGPQKAKEAYAVYQEFQPDGVIAADDNVQAMFVLPYLKDKVETPVIFCGVNADAEQYGYPTSHISGVLERWHIRESIAFMKQIDPSVKTIGFIAKDSPSGKALLQQVNREFDTYLAQFTAFKLPKTKQEMATMLEELKAQSDVIYMDSMEGIPDEKGNPLTSQELIQFVSTTFGKPLIGANQYHVKQGALCAVIKTGQEQGRTAAEMLSKAIQGTPVSELPITANQHGKRMINAMVMKSLGMKPHRRALIGVELIKTSE